jgi:hypothetical protein
MFSIIVWSYQDSFLSSDLLDVGGVVLACKVFNFMITAGLVRTVLAFLFNVVIVEHLNNPITGVTVVPIFNGITFTFLGDVIDEVDMDCHIQVPFFNGWWGRIPTII